MSLKAVAFDVDGTLYPNGQMIRLSLPLVFAHFRLLKALEDVRGELRAQPDLSGDFHRVQAQHLGKRLRIAPERAFALVEGKIYTQWYRIFRRLRPFPHLLETLRAFKAAGLKLAVMSDFPIRGRLADLGLPNLWDASFSSEETGYLKPHPQPFLLLAERLGLPPQDVLYVGNSHRYDVLGAQGVGMPTAYLGKNRRKALPATFAFQNYLQLREFVLNNLKK